MALGGCFCINNSCGTNLVYDNTQTVMNVIGGGVAGAIQKTDSRYAISNVVIDGMDATYYGQNSGACVASSSGPANAEQYYYNPGSMSSDASTEAATEAATSTSLYGALKTASAAENYSVKTCTISRAVAMNWDAMGQCTAGESINDACAAIDADPACNLKEEKVDSVDTIYDYNPTGLVPTSSCAPLIGTKTASCSYICPVASNVPCMLDSGSPRCTVGSTTYDCAVYNPIQSASGNWELDADEHDTDVRFFGSGNRLYVYGYDFDGNAEGILASIALNGASVSGSTPYYPGSFSITAVGGNTLVFGDGSRITVSGVYLEGSMSCLSYIGVLCPHGKQRRVHLWFRRHRIQQYLSLARRYAVYARNNRMLQNVFRRNLRALVEEGADLHVRKIKLRLFIRSEARIDRNAVYTGQYVVYVLQRLLFVGFDVDDREQFLCDEQRVPGEHRKLSAGVQDGDERRQHLDERRLQEKRCLPGHDDSRLLLPCLHVGGMPGRAGGNNRYRLPVHRRFRGSGGHHADPEKRSAGHNMQRRNANRPSVKGVGPENVRNHALRWWVTMKGARYSSFLDLASRSHARASRFSSVFSLIPGKVSPRARAISGKPRETASSTSTGQRAGSRTTSRIPSRRATPP